MNIYVYSDESGVFDRFHETYFVFGGLIFLDKEKRDSQARLYKNAEKAIYESCGISFSEELKASRLDNKYKGKLYRSLNHAFKFGVIVVLDSVLDEIYGEKRSKQRYLDYVYKIAVKQAFKQMMGNGVFQAKDVENLIFYTDEHTTATNGRYELREALLQEFKIGTFNRNYQCFYEPLFPGMKDVQLSYCDSSKVPLVRAADIVANRLYYYANHDNWTKLRAPEFYISLQP